MKKKHLRRMVKSRLAAGKSRQEVFDELATKYPGAYEHLLELIKYQMTLEHRKQYGWLLRLLQVLMLAYTVFTVYMALENPQWSVKQYLFLALVLSVQGIAIYGVSTQPLRVMYLFCLAAIYGPYNAGYMPDIMHYIDYAVRLVFLVLPLFLVFKATGKYQRTQKLSAEEGQSRTLEWAEFVR